MAAQVTTKILGAILTIVVARQLGAADYGLYGFATTVGYAFGLLITFGLTLLIPREVARRIDETDRMLGDVFTLEGGFLVIGSVALVGMLSVLRYPAQRMWIVGIIGFTMMLNSQFDITAAFFRAHQRMELEAVQRVFFSVLNLGMGLAILAAGYGVLQLASVQLLACILALSLALFLVVRKLARPVFNLRRRALRKLVVAAFPFAVITVLVFAYDGTAPIFITFLKGDRATGVYIGALNFVRIFGILPASLMAAVLPAMSRLWPDSPGVWRILFGRSLKYLLIMALPLAVGMAMLSEKIVILILGVDYAASALVLRLAAWAMIPVFLNYGLTIALFSIDKEKVFARIVVVALVINASANLALISRWGAPGAVGASLLTEGYVFVAQCVILVKVGLWPSLATDSLKPVVSVVAMALAIYLTSRFGLAPAVLSGVVVYVCLLCVLRTFEPDEMEQVRSLWAAALVRLQGRTQEKPTRM